MHQLSSRAVAPAPRSQRLRLGDRLDINFGISWADLSSDGDVVERATGTEASRFRRARHHDQPLSLQRPAGRDDAFMAVAVGMSHALRSRKPVGKLTTNANVTRGVRY